MTPWNARCARCGAYRKGHGDPACPKFRRKVTADRKKRRGVLSERERRELAEDGRFGDIPLPIERIEAIEAAVLRAAARYLGQAIEPDSLPPAEGEMRGRKD